MHGQVSLKAKWQNELKSLQQLSHNFIKIRIHKLIQIKFKEKSVIEARTSIFQEKKSMFKDINFLPSKSFYKKYQNHTHQCLWFLLEEYFLISEKLFSSPWKREKKKNHEKNLPQCESQNIFFLLGRESFESNAILTAFPRIAIIFIYLLCS